MSRYKNLLIAAGVALISCALWHAWLTEREMQGKATSVETVPAWANFFTLEQYKAFLSKLDQYFRRKGVPFQIGDGVVYLTEPNGEKSQRGLTNIAQSCARIDESSWDATIQKHFDAVAGASDEQKAFMAQVSNFDLIKTKIAVRIGSIEDLPKATLISRQDLPQTLSYLVYDLPNSVRSVSPKDTTTWGQSEQQLFDLAIDNVQHFSTPKIDRIDIKPGISFFAMAGDSFYIASHALLLNRHPELIGSNGSLVAIPTRNILLCYPIENLDIVQVIQPLARVAQQSEKNGPGSITSRLYWYHDGRFSELPYEIKDKQFNFMPPAPFFDMMNHLKPPPPSTMQ